MMANTKDNVVTLPTARVEHWEGPVRCLLCGAEHRAVAPVISWAESRQPVDCGSCGAVRSCIEVDIDFEQAFGMTESEVDASLREQGLDPERVAAEGQAVISRLMAEHKARSERRAQDVAAYELELADLGISDIWRAIFGSKHPQPRRPQALQRIFAMVMHVRWPASPPRNLPLGLVPDDDPGA